MALTPTTGDSLYSQFQSILPPDIEQQKNAMFAEFSKQNPSNQEHKDEFMETAGKILELFKSKAEELEKTIDITNFRKEWINNADRLCIGQCLNLMESYKESIDNTHSEPVKSYFANQLKQLSNQYEYLKEELPLVRQITRDLFTGKTEQYQKAFKEHYYDEQTGEALEVSEGDKILKDLEAQMLDIFSKDQCDLDDEVLENSEVHDAEYLEMLHGLKKYLNNINPKGVINTPQGILTESLKSKTNLIKEKGEMQLQDGSIKGVLYSIKKGYHTTGYLFGTFHFNLKKEDMEKDPTLKSIVSQMDNVAPKVQEKLNSSIALATETEFDQNIDKINELGVSVEQMLLKSAIEQGMKNIGLETLENALSHYTKLKKEKNGPTDQNEWFATAFEEYKSGGDLANAFEKIPGSDKHDPLLESRNIEMANNIDTWMKAAEEINLLQPPKIFFAVGAAHLFATKGNPGTIISILEEKGWKIELIKQ